MAKPTLYSDEMIAGYRRKGYWRDLTIADFWDRNAVACPDNEAVVDHRSRLTWLQAKQWTDNTALGLLGLGLKRDSMVVVQLPNWTELPLIRVCCEKAGLLCLPVLRSLRETEMEYVLRHSAAEAIIIPWEFRGFDYFRMISEMRPRLPDLKHVIVAGDQGFPHPDRSGRHPNHLPPGAVSLTELSEGLLASQFPAGHLARTKYPATEFSLVLLTSGSTGVPKFVEHPICSRVLLGRSYAEATKLGAEDIIALLAPAFVGPNSLAYYGAPQAAAKIVMLEHFDVGSALRLIEQEKVTIIGVVPAQLAMVLVFSELNRYNLKTLRLIICTGAPLPFRVAVEAEEKLKASLIQFYGSVDGGGSTIPSLEDSQEIRHLTVGKPMPGVEIKLISDGGRSAAPGGIGEVWVRGATMVSGYYKDPAMNATCWTPDGWFKTGDYGKWSADGNLAIVGRKKEMIIRGGQNIYPAEIENLLITHPAVREVAVVGMPDAVMGEKACAFVVLKNGPEYGEPASGRGELTGVRHGESSGSPLSRFTFENMTAFLKAKGIASYKLPERLELVDSLPTVAGEQKVNKPVLKETIAAKLAAEAIFQLAN